jgi:WD40 repeat protein
VDGRQVVVVASGDGWLRMWDVASGRPVGGEFGAGQGILTGVACVRAQGRTVALTTDEDGQVCAFDLGISQMIDRHAYAHEGSAYAVACTTAADPPLVVTTGGGGSVRVWKLGETLVPLYDLSGHRDAVETVACATMRSRDVAITGGVDGQVIAWDLAERRRIFDARPRRGWVRAVAGAVLGGRPVAVTGASGGALAVWDLSSALPEAPAAAPVAVTVPRDVQISRVDVLGEDAVRLVYANGGSVTVDPSTGQPVDGAAVPRITRDEVEGFSMHGRTVVAVVGDDPRVLWLRDTAPDGGHGLALGRHESRITAVAVGRPGGGEAPLLFSGDADGRVRVWGPEGRSMPGFAVPGEVSGITAVRGELLVNMCGEVIAFRHVPERRPRRASR